MTRQLLNRGTTANDGTGDTLRSATLKIEQNLTELYLKLGGDSTVLMPKVSFDSNHLVFEGATIDNYELRLGAADATDDRVVIIPDHTGVLLTDSAEQTVTNKTIVYPTLVQPYIAESADAVHTFHIHAAKLTGYRDINLPALTDSDEFTFNNHTQTLNNKTINAAQLNNPRIGTELQDSNGNQYIEFGRTVGAVNHIKVQNNTNTNPPIISAVGGDTNIDLELQGKGTGAVKIGTKMKLGYQTMTASGAVSLTTPITWFNSGGTQIDATMADLSNTDKGTIKYLINQNNGTAVITPTNLQNYTTITLLVNQSATVVWDGTEWFALNVGGDSAGGILA